MFQTDEKYERKLKSLQLELMNLGALKDKLERQLLYDKLSPGVNQRRYLSSLVYPVGW
nr:MAG TPA: hypothetical protein [Caudoviricetes sp.]